MVVSKKDLIPEYKDPGKNRLAWAFSWEALAELIGIEGEVINMYIDPTREIIRIITRDPSVQVPEGCEMPETTKVWTLEV